jgi:hypothetical protein
MIRFLSYIGTKDVKAINIACGRKVVFTRGEPVDIVEAGMEQRKAKQILKTGLFKLHGEKAVPFDIPEADPVVDPNTCTCGKVCKNLAGLKAHQRRCSG